MNKELISVTEVKTIECYRMSLLFSTGERGEFDMNPYLEIGVFQKLKNKDLFAQAYISFGTVAWPNNLDIAPETLYLESKKYY